MSKITYANKQTAVDPNNPAPNEIFYATDANEVKASVNDLYDRLDNITLIDGFVSGPTLIATSSTNVAVQTFTQNVALIYNANNFQYTRNAGAADLTFTATPDATFDKGCIIQANGTTISLKQGVAAANVIYPTPDTGYVQIYSFIISTTGISSILDSLGSYLELNNLNSGNVVIDGFYKQQGIISKVLKTASDGTFVGIDGTSAQYIKGDGSLGTLASDFVTSVGLTMPSAFQVSGSPITTSGTIAVQGAGNATQYIAGDGTLVTFPVAGQAGTLVTEVRNVSGATMTKGTIVYINGADLNKPTIAKAIATGDFTSGRTLGFLQTDIANNSNGYCVVVGLLTGLDTTAFTAGTQLYLSGLTAGAYTSTKSLAPTHLVYVGKVTRSHVSLGQIEVGIQNGFELEELHDVAIASPLQGHGIFWNEALSLWMNSSIAVALGYTPIGGSGTTNYLPKFTGTTSIGNSLIYDNGTNVGIGVTPSAWNVGKAVEFFYQGNSLWTYSQDNIYLLANAYFNGGFKYGGTGYSTNYTQYQGQHQWLTAPSGTAGNAISFTQAMTLDASGRLGIGTTSPAEKLSIKAADAAIKLEGTTNSYLFQVVDSNNRLRIFDNTNNAERITLNSSGNVGIGTSVTNGKLTILEATTSFEVNTSSTLSSILSYDRTGGVYKQLQFRGSEFIFSPSDVEKMRLTAAGNLGIGTTTSYNSAKLSINGEGISIWRIRTIAGGELPLAIGSQSVTNETVGLAGMYHVEYGSGGFGQSGGLIFKTSANDSAPTERMRIHGQSGNLGIGTTSPQSLLHVNGVITFGGDTRYGVSKIYDANTGDGFGLEQVSAAQSGLAGAGTRLFTANGGSNFISLGKYTTATAFTSWLHITQAGSVGIGTTSPTSKLQVTGLPSYADNTTAIAGGLTAGAFYHTAGVLKVVI